MSIATYGDLYQVDAASAPAVGGAWIFIGDVQHLTRPHVSVTRAHLNSLLRTECFLLTMGGNSQDNIRVEVQVAPKISFRSNLPTHGNILYPRTLPASGTIIQRQGGELFRTCRIKSSGLLPHHCFLSSSTKATLAHSYIEKREAFAFLVPKTMINRRRKWRQQEREKAVKNVFEAQMHVRMRRQSLKQVETREPQDVEEDCVTLDLSSARSRDSCQVQEQHATDKANEVKTSHWVPHCIAEELSTPSSSEESESPFSPRGMDCDRPDNDLVLKVRQTLTQDAKFRLERLGGLDMSLVVPTFAYRVFLAGEYHYSGDATEGSTGVYRLPRLLHNSRVNLSPRPAPYYL